MTSYPKLHNKDKVSSCKVSHPKPQYDQNVKVMGIGYDLVTTLKFSYQLIQIQFLLNYQEKT